MNNRPAENYGLPGLPTEVEYLRSDRAWLSARIAQIEAQNTALLADVNQDEGYERLKAALRRIQYAFGPSEWAHQIATEALGSETETKGEQG